MVKLTHGGHLWRARTRELLEQLWEAHHDLLSRLGQNMQTGVAKKVAPPRGFAAAADLYSGDYLIDH